MGRSVCRSVCLSVEKSKKAKFLFHLELKLFRIYELWGGVSMGRSVCRSVCLSVEKIKKAKFKLAVCRNYSSKQWIPLIYKFIRLSTLYGSSKSRKLPR